MRKLSGDSILLLRVSWRRAARLAGVCNDSAEAFFEGLEESLSAERVAGALIGADGRARLGSKAAGEEG